MSNVGLLINNILKARGRNPAWFVLKYYANILLKRLRRDTKTSAKAAGIPFQICMDSLSHVSCRAKFLDKSTLLLSFKSFRLHR